MRSAIEQHKTFDLPNIASLLVGINSRIVVGFSENQDQGHELNVSMSPMVVNENDDSSVVMNECVLPVAGRSRACFGKKTAHVQIKRGT